MRASSRDPARRWFGAAGARPGDGGARDASRPRSARRAAAAAGDARRSSRAALDDRRAVVAFLLRLLAGWALAMGLLSLLPGIERWAVASTVDGVRWALRLASLDPVVRGATITLGPAALRIIPECTPLMPTLMFGIAVVAYPAAPAWKLIGVGAGAALLWIYNVVRMLALIATLTWWPSGFSFHVYLWQTVTRWWCARYLGVAAHGARPGAGQVRWLLRFFLWATVLAPAGCWRTPSSRPGCAICACWAFAHRPRRSLRPTFCLARARRARRCAWRARAPGRRRLAAMAAGLAGLGTLDGLTGVAAIAG
jgi:exosortase/archaeosortase family protein